VTTGIKYQLKYSFPEMKSSMYFSNMSQAIVQGHQKPFYQPWVKKYMIYFNNFRSLQPNPLEFVLCLIELYPFILIPSGQSGLIAPIVKIFISPDSCPNCVSS
jgi:hypothetical protein